MKTHNSYAGSLEELFDKIPKSVFAAIAVSFATHGGDFIEEAKERIMDEWKALHSNGIVPQKPFPFKQTSGYEEA